MIPARIQSAASVANGAPPLLSLLGLSLLSAALFSATFVFNYAMSLDGGSWVWSAVLRYAFTILLLAVILQLVKGRSYMAEIFRVFGRHILFWIFAGTFACGFFYAGITYAADHLRGWMVAATWQLTILASPIVLYLFGYRFPRRGFVFAVVVLVGIACLNWEHAAGGLSSLSILSGIVPLVVSAFAYPAGNQLLNSAKNGGLSFVPRIRSHVLSNPFAGILLLSMGSVPFWILLVLVFAPPPPGAGQFLQTFFVALLAGVGATSIFYFARNCTSDPFRIIAVDAVQSSEVLFALGFELIYLNPVLPSAYEAAGVLIVVAGLLGYCFRRD